MPSRPSGLSSILALLAVAAILPSGCGQGETSTSPGPSTEEKTSSSTADGGAKLPPGDQLFASGELLNVELALSKADAERLEESGNEELYLPAEVKLTGAALGTITYAKVGLRHKGAWSLHHCWDDFGGIRSYAAECAKLSYKIKFHEYQRDQRLDGLKRLNLHAVSGDGSKMRDMVAYQTFRDFGIDAPRTTPARVTLNGELLGLFIVVEAIDGRYTAGHFPEGGDGNLYKEVWPHRGASQKHFVDALRTNEESTDVSDFAAFAKAVEATTEADFDERMERWLDVPQLLRYIAVDRALRNWDGIMAFYVPRTPHNFYWYHDDGTEDRFHLIPWDLDNTLWSYDPYMAPEGHLETEPVPDWNRAPANCTRRSVWEPGNALALTPPRCDTLLDRLAVLHWAEFEEAVEELLAGPFSTAAIATQISRWSEVLEPLVKEDPTLSPSPWKAQVRELSRNAERAAFELEAMVKEGLTTEAEPEFP